MPVLNLLFRLFYWPYNIILSQWARQTKCSLVIILPPTVRTPSWANRECMFNARESCMNSNKRTTILRTIRTLGRFDGAQNNNNRSCFLFFFCTFFFFIIFSYALFTTYSYYFYQERDAIRVKMFETFIRIIFCCLRMRQYT